MVILCKLKDKQYSLFLLMESVWFLHMSDICYLTEELDKFSV